MQGGFDDWYKQNENYAFPDREKTYTALREKLDRVYRLYSDKDILISAPTWNKLDDFYERMKQARFELRQLQENQKIKPKRSIEDFDQDFDDMAEELKAEYETVLGIRSSRRRAKENKTEEVVKGRKRVALGFAGAALTGLSVGWLLYIVNVVAAVEILPCGALAGLGVAMFLEYIRPSRKPIGPAKDTRPSGEPIGSPELPAPKRNGDPSQTPEPEKVERQEQPEGTSRNQSHGR